MLQARIYFVTTASKRLGSENVEGAIRLANHFHDVRENHVTPFEGAIETLEYFQGLGTKMALITNGDKETQRNKINKFALNQYFDYVLIEGEFGLGKPHFEVYQYILDKLKVSAKETWIVGDNLDWKVRALQELGIYSIWNEGLPVNSQIVPNRVINRISELKTSSPRVSTLLAQ